MFQLRSFVHQRLYAAAEEILGEVEKVMTLALYEADVQRLIQEPDSPSPKLNSQRQISEPPLINSDVAEEESLQKISSQPSTQEESYLSKAEVPGPSETTEERCVVQVHFGIKEEQEEHGYYSQTQDVMYPFEEVAKREEDQPETEGFDEMQLVTSDGSEAFSDNRGSDEERVKRKEASMNVNISAQREKERLVCPTCGKGFWYISPFVKHIETHKKSESVRALVRNLQSSNDKSFCCRVCGKTFSTAGGLKVHSKIHAGIKDFKCQYCGITFVQKGNLISHLRTHSGERPFQCDLCGKAFGQKQNLTVHKKRRHPGATQNLCGSGVNDFTVVFP
uniref:C2H2-type domain-containing protein n=1 Tax=Labrus bergylta TaxID=56723 RepID=A0A3Q3GXP6_9LABR